MGLNGEIVVREGKCVKGLYLYIRKRNCRYVKLLYTEIKLNLIIHHINVYKMKYHIKFYLSEMFFTSVWVFK